MLYARDHSQKEVRNISYHPILRSWVIHFQKLYAKWFKVTWIVNCSKKNYIYDFYMYFEIKKNYRKSKYRDSFKSFKHVNKKNRSGHGELTCNASTSEAEAMVLICLKLVLNTCTHVHIQTHVPTQTHTCTYLVIYSFVKFPHKGLCDLSSLLQSLSVSSLL